MKNLISFILLLNFIFFASKGFAIDYVLNVSFKTTLRVEGSDRFIDAVIVLNPQHSRATILSDLEIRADVDSKFFDATPNNSGFTFRTFDAEWSNPDYYQLQLARIVYIAPISLMELYWATDDVGYLDECLDSGDCSLEMNVKEDYEWGVFSWKLLPSATGKVRIRLREEAIEDGMLACIAYNDREQEVILSFVGDNIERDETGAACIVVDVTDPFAGVDPPVDLAGVTKVCGTPQTLEYTVTRPATVDSCAWFISTDEAGNNPVSDDVASIILADKGEKATITWKKTTGVENYFIQVKSVAATGESDPVHMAVRVEDFPDFAGVISSDIACRSTELSWVSPKDGITTEVYLSDYSGTALTSPYTCTEEATFHVVRYREAAQCRDTSDFAVPFLNPRIQWMMAPVATAQRGDELRVLVNEPTGIPATYTPAAIDYIWVKPGTQPKEYKAYVTTAVNKKYEYEVFVKVDGCSSDTLTGSTEVMGGGIKPMLSTESGQDIACKDGGVLLKTEPDGGSGNYSYKWYAGAVSGTSLATTSSIWVSPTADTKYIVEVTDEVSSETVLDTISIIYKDVASPVVDAGSDQQIVSGTYTYLLGKIITDGASTNYTWNWKPDTLLTGNTHAQHVQTTALKTQRKYTVYVVDDNGCMSKPDSVNVDVIPVLPPELEPDVEGETFDLAVVPESAVLCKNNSVQFDIKASGINLEDATYSWTPATGLDATDILNPVLTAVDGVTSGDYFVTVTKGDFSIVRKATVTVNMAEEAPQLQLAEKRMSCTGDVVEVVVTGAEPDRYVWIVDGVEFENTEKTYTLTDAGEHTIKVYGKNNGATCASDTLSVSGTFGEGVILTDVTPDVKVCGSEAVLSFASINPADAPFKWLAEDDSEISSTDKSIVVNQEGEYRLICGSGTCADTNRIQVVLNNVLMVEGLKPMVTGCQATAELAFNTTSAPAFVWLNDKGVEIADSKNKNPYEVTTEGIYHLRLDGGDCQETFPVKVVLNTKPVVNDVLDSLTTCGDELAICGTASQGTLYWAEDRDGNTLVTTGVLTGSNETKIYYVYADAGGDCKGEPKEVKVSFGSAPKVIVNTLQTSCGTSCTLQAMTTGTGSVKWYESQTAVTPLADISVKGDAGSSREYWACAEDGDACKSERVKVLVKFGVAPILEVNELQTTCGNELDLTASTTGGELIWKEVGASSPLLLTRVTGNNGEIKHYEVYAEDGSCISETKTVEVRFGANPEVLADNLYTTCGEQFTLKGTASAGTLTWYSDAAGKHALTSLTVNKGAADVTTYYARAVDGTCQSPLKDVRVAFNSDPYVEALTPQTSCDANAVIALKATTTGGSLIWENEDGTKLASSTVNAPGTYYVYAEDGSCKSTKEEVEVKFGTDPVLTVEKVQTSCGKEYTLKGTASGGILKWYDTQSADRKEINTLVTGSTGSSATYYVKAVDGRCESAEMEVTVKFGMPPTVTVEPEINTCENVVKLQAATTGGTLYWKEKSTGKVLPIPQVTGIAGTSATYVVYAQDATCKGAEQQVKVMFGTEPQVIVEKDITTCDEEYVLTAESTDPTATLHWLEADKTTPVTVAKGASNSSKKYYVYAKTPDCEGQMTEVTVHFGSSPTLNVKPITTCDTIAILEAESSVKNLVWTDESGKELASTQVHGASGTKRVYYVRAEDGRCVSEQEAVQVDFGKAPELIVEDIQTVCSADEYELQAEATGKANLVWYQADGITPLTNTTIRKVGNTALVYYVEARDGSCVSEKEKVSVLFDQAPILTIDKLLQTTCGESLTLQASASAGEIVWMKPDGTKLDLPLVSGSAGEEQQYYVYAQDATCESVKKVVTVRFGVTPNVDVNLVQTACGESHDLTAISSDGVLHWLESDQKTELKSTTVTGSKGSEKKYYVYAENGKDCKSDLIAVTVMFGKDPMLVDVLNPQTTCGTALQLTAGSTAGEVEWRDALGNLLTTTLVTQTTPGEYTYYVQAKDETCASASQEVTAMFGTRPQVISEEIQSTCSISSYEIAATATEGILHYLDTDRKTELASATVTSAGTYYVYAQAPDCVSDTVPVEVKFGTKPEVIVEKMLTTCATADYELQATASAGATVHWLEADGVTPLASTIVSGAANTTASYWVYADMGSCRSDKQEVTVAFGVAPIVSVLDTLTTCGTSLTLNATTSAGTLKWLDDKQKELSNTTVNNILGTPKEYYVYAQDGDCESVKHKVVALFKTQPKVLADWLQTTCDPETYELQAQATDGTLHWLAADKTPLTSTTVKGMKGEPQVYYVYAEKDASCKSKEYQITVEFGADPMLEVITPQTVCGMGDVVVDLKAVTTGGKLVWEDEDGNVLATTQQEATAPMTKYYYVHAEDKTCTSVKEKVEVRFGGQPVVLANELQTSCGESLTLSGKASNGSLIWKDSKKIELKSTTVVPSQGDTYYVMAKDGECESAEMKVNVLFNTKPEVTVVTPQTTCETQIQLEANTTGGELVWLNANGDKINLTQVSAPKGTKATYFVYAKGETCESPREMVEVEFGTLPRVIVEENQTACGTSHVLTASATDGELVWMDASRNILSSTTVSGTSGESKDYYVYAKAIDCEGEPQKVTVHFGQSPVVHVKDLQTTCEESLLLQASATGGELVWTAEDGTELPTAVVSGNLGENAYYYVTAKDGACQSVTERVEVRFGAKPEVLLASDVFTTCGTEYALEAEATSGQVNWYASKESTTKLASTLVTKPEGADYAEYYVQAQNGSCVGEKQKVTVVFGSKPLITVTTPQSTCDTRIVLSATTTGGELVWRDSRNEILTSSLVEGTKGSVGTYYVQAQEKDGSCQSEMKEVFVNFGTVPSVNVITDQTVCETKLELKATATGGDVYWLRNDKLPLASTHVEGVKGSSELYYVYASDGSCKSDTVEVNVAFGEGPRLEVVDVQTSCGDVVELQGKTSGGTLKWTNADGSLILPAVVTKPASANQLICYVEAVDGSCTTDRQQVTVKFGTMPEILTETLQTSCDTVYTLVASASAGNIVWEDQEHHMLTSTTVHGQGIKTYYAYASAGKDCVSEKVKVKVAFGTNPVVNVEPLQTACGETLELKATTSAGILVWEKEGGAQLAQTTVTPAMGDTYQVYALDGKCKSRVTTVDVKFNANPVVTVEPLQTTCGEELELCASASGGEVLWVDGNSDPISTKVSSANGATQDVYVYAQDGSCMSDPIAVTVKFGERPVLHDLQTTQSACTSPYQLQASSTGGNIVWLQNGQELLENWADLVEGENIFFVHVEDESCSPVASADEKVTVILGGRPELTLTTTHCAGDSIFAEEVNGLEGLTYHWFINGKEEAAVTGRTYAFAEGGEFTVQVVAETDGGCVSDTVSGTYQIAAPIHLAWAPEPVSSIIYGNNIQGCAKVTEGEDTDITWHWVSPTTLAITGACANVAAQEQEYEFIVYATNKQGCASDTLMATTQVTGFGDLDVTLESSTGTEICKDGSALLTATVNGGQAPYTYEWFVKGTTTIIQKVTTSSAINVLAIAPQADVTYAVKVRDAQVKPGIANKEIALTVKEGNVPVADAGPDMTIQRGLQTVLKAGGGDDITAWEWLPMEKLAAADEAVKQYPLTMNLSTSQKYQLFVTNTEGCISKPDEMIVYVLPLDGTEEGLPTPPTSEGLNLVIRPETDTLCLGAERWIAVKDLLGNLSGNATYTWVASPSVALTMNVKRDSALFVPATAGNYTFSVFVEDGGKKMALRSTILVKDGQAPQFDLVATGNCQYDTVKMIYKDGSVKADQWEWKVKGNVVANAADYYVLANAGDYKVEVTAGNGGCGSVQKATEVTVADAPQITDLVVLDSCGRVVIELTATGATAGYTWTANPTGAVETGMDNRYVITTVGKYEAEVEASNGTCSVVRSIEGEVYARPQLLAWVAEPMDVSQVNTLITAAVSAQGGKPDYEYHWLQPDDAKANATSSYTQEAILASYTFEVYASDANGCISDTLKKSISVAGGQVEVDVKSVYGKEICEGGAAMLVAHAKGVELPCVFEWSKVGTAGVRRSVTQNSVFDTLWVKASEVGSYKVQVKQFAASAILASAQIDGLTVNASKHAPEVATEKTLTIPEGGKTVLLATVSNGTPEYKWHWSPADKLETLADTALQYPQTAALNTRQEYQTYVTDAEGCVSVPATTLVDVDNNFGLCVAINPKNAEICRGNVVRMNADITCGKPVGYDLEYSWLPVEHSALLDATDKDSVAFTPVQSGEYTWVVEVKNGTLIAAARTVITVKDADAPVLSLDGRWDCVNDTLILTNSGEPAEKYVWSVDGIEVAETGERLVLVDAEVKRVQVYAVSANGCLSDSISVETHLGVVPEVEIAGDAFVNYPDSVSVLQVKQVDGLTTDDYDFAWTSVPDNKINGATNLLAAVTLPMTEDVKYTFVATSKTNPVCQATDTAWAYMIPKSAPVEIDKDENSGELYLSWNKDILGLADSVRVMNIKWDGYAVESFYQPKAMAVGDLEKYTIDTSKDTLEFFYINASRYIPEMGRSYYSLSSDTVGYFKQWLYSDAENVDGNNVNYISYPFDMTSKGLKNSHDLGEYVGSYSTGLYSGKCMINSLSKFVGDKQSWAVSRDYYLRDLGMWNQEKALFDLVQGDIYEMVLQDDAADVVLIFYGKLPSRFSYSILSASSTEEGIKGDNFMAFPLSFVGKRKLTDLGDVINDINSLSAYTFKTLQTWSSDRIYWVPGGNLWSGKVDFHAYPWMPVNVIVNTNTLFDK